VADRVAASLSVRLHPPWELPSRDVPPLRWARRTHARGGQLHADTAGETPHSLRARHAGSPTCDRPPFQASRRSRCGLP
jgi:hypothetical protein